jgi:hypothetical protein
MWYVSRRWVASELVPLGIAQEFETNGRLLDTLVMSTNHQAINQWQSWLAQKLIPARTLR